MARFYGTIQGARGEATRLGHKNSGMRVTAQSYNGDVMVNLNAAGDTDVAFIAVEGHDGTGRFCLFSDDVSKLLTAEGQAEWIKSLVRNHKLSKEIIHEFAQEAIREHVGANHETGQTD